MKIILDNDNIKVYLNKEYTKKIDVNNLSEFEEYFSRILLRLKKKYQLEISGYYDLKILYDEFYGFAITINRHDFEYPDFLDRQVDFDLTINKTNFFMYEISDPFEIDHKLLKNIMIYIYNKKLYLKLISDIGSLEMGRLLEFSNLISGEEVDQIINKGKIIFNWVYVYTLFII